MSADPHINPPTFDEAIARLPLVAILRGVQAEAVCGIADGLLEAGFSLIEVPLNSPDPMRSIALLARHVAGRALVGAGTVLQVDQVAQVQQAGGGLIVMPHGDTAIVRAAKAAGMVCLPGVATPTEAFAALAAGADGLKLFPAEASSPAALKAMRAVLPPATRVFPVGGIHIDNLQPWMAAGATGFGLGSALYKPGDDAAIVARQARRFVDAWRSARATQAGPGAAP
jgi:2-dehydro-3-deoxyphosphogalactonate aldolase